MDILNGLNEPQKKAVITTEGPILILAGAGSGKTKALTHRIAYLVSDREINSHNILAVTFTNKAAQEMIDRVNHLLNSKFEIRNSKQIQNNKNLNSKQFNKFGNLNLDIVSNLGFSASNLRLPWMGTFHRICGKILRYELNPSTLLRTGLDLPYSSSFTIYDDSDQKQLIKKCLKELDKDPKKYNPNSILSFISGAKNELLLPKDYRPYAVGLFQRVVADVYDLYQKKLIEADALDFDDMLMITVKLFEKYPRILEKYQKIFRYILVDEYQDTNHAQYILINLLAKKNRNICVVGDDYQSIYSFRGANFQNILDFEKDYPDACVIKLEQNYRSTTNILEAAQAVIKNNRNRTDKKLWTEKKSDILISIVEVDSEKEEAEFVAQEMSVLLRYYPTLNSFAVLYRTNAQSRAVEEALIKAELPYKIVGGVRFYERKEIKDLIAYMRYLINPNDVVSFERIVNVPTRGIGEKTLQSFLNAKFKMQNSKSQIKIQNEEIPPKIKDFIKLINDLREEIKSKTPAQVVDIVINKTGYKDWINDGTIEGESRLENIKELITVAMQYKSLEEFLESVALVQDQDQYESSANAITLMTLHCAKGLEFPVVFIVGMEEGIFPHSRSLIDEAELEEERRLCYVGITRSKERLYLLSSRARSLWGRMQVNMRSRFIDEIPDEVKEEI